jgi:hypothetical protein
MRESFQVAMVRGYSSECDIHGYGRSVLVPIAYEKLMSKEGCHYWRVVAQNVAADVVARRRLAEDVGMPVIS